MTPYHIFLLFAAVSNSQENASPKGAVGDGLPISLDGGYEEDQSRWRRRTAKRRQRADDLLDSIEAGGLQLPPKFMSGQGFGVPTMKIPTSSRINWTVVDPTFDPMHGGMIRKTDRGIRKRAQINAFYYVLSSLIDTKLESTEKNETGGITVIDAGCGAGNLAVALAGLLPSNIERRVSILAVDVNEQALYRLEDRAQTSVPTKTTLKTFCADLADYKNIYSQVSDQNVIVVSLHACGAASDMAMNLALRCNNAPFLICPCCTAKSLTKRINHKDETSVFDKSASFQRSGASGDILYPRSTWLKSKMLKSTLFTLVEDQYAILAKVADVGLGPQTPTKQRQTQNRAKKVVELDRLMSALENEDYDVHLMRLPDHDPLIYSKGDLLLGAKGGSAESRVLQTIFDESYHHHEQSTVVA
jgi:hypothetical protein